MLSALLILAATCSQAKEMEAVLGQAQADPKRYDQLDAEVDTLQDAVADSNVSAGRIYDMSHDIFDRLSQTAVNAVPERHVWDFGTAPEKTQATTDRLARAMKVRIDDFKGVPPPELLATASAADGMNAAGRVSFNEKMAANEMGIYEYIVHKAESGLIRLNQMLAWIATEIGDEFAAATLVHEGRHRLDHANGRLSLTQKIAVEIAAFKAEFLYLVTTDPKGERLAYRRSALNYDQHFEPTSRRAAAIAYADHLAELRATGGDEEAIKRIVERDYGDDAGHPLRN